MQLSHPPRDLPASLFRLETPRLTAIFWGTIALFTAAFFSTPYLPLIDYQQHVALAALLRRLANPAAPEHALYDVNLITYNGGFHVLVAALGFVLPVEQAGRIIMATFPTLFGLAALALVRETQRPRWYALLALPITYSRGMAWGFANWNLTYPIAILTFTWWLRYIKGEKKMLPRLLVASFFCAYGHVLAMLMLCFCLGVTQLSRLRELGARPNERLQALIATPLPIMPGIVWCLFVYRYQTSSSFSNWAESFIEGLDDPLWFKLRHVLTMSVGNLTNGADNLFLAIALLLAAVLLSADSAEPMLPHGPAALDLRAVRWLALGFLGCYLVIPKVFVATWFVYERFPPVAVLFLVGSLPLRLFALRRALRFTASGLALFSGLITWHAWAWMGEAHDASAIIDDIPAGHRLMGVVYDNETAKIGRGVFVHLPALYQIRRPGEIAYTFTKFESMIVHYRPGKAPPPPPPSLAVEWNAANYDPHAPWAQAYDRTLVHAPASTDEPTTLVFRDLAPLVRPLARRGRFWLYDTSRLAMASPLLSTPPAVP